MPQQGKIEGGGRPRSSLRACIPRCCGRSALPLGGCPRGVDPAPRWTGPCHSSIIHVTFAYLLVKNLDEYRRLYPCCLGQFFSSSHSLLVCECDVSLWKFLKRTTPTVGFGSWLIDR